MRTTITQHGVLISVFKTGLLLTGESGIGKSELALTLIKNGHQLIADDIVDLYEENENIIGTCPPILKDFIEVRGLGIMNVRKLFGADALTEQSKVDLIIDLKESTFICN